MATNESKPAPRPTLPDPGKTETHGAPKPPTTSRPHVKGVPPNTLLGAPGKITRG
jgi:hypothetical protein